MKKLIFFLTVFFFSLFLSSIAHAKTYHEVNYNYFGETLTDQQVLSQLKQDQPGDGVIQGQLFDRSSGNPIGEEVKFYAVLYKQHPRFGSWDAVASVDSGEGQYYEFTGLETGEYAVVVSWKLSESESPNYETAFLPTIWSPTGGELCYRCEPTQSKAISLTPSNPNYQANFELDKAAVLEIEQFTNQYDLSGSSNMYSIDESGLKRGFQLNIYEVTHHPTSPSTVVQKTVFLLPKGVYYIYAEQGRYQGAIYGETEPCKHCEFKVRSGVGDMISLMENQATLTEISMEKISGGFKGLIKDTDSPSFMVIDFNNNISPDRYYTQNNTDTNPEYPLELNVTNLASGYYMMTIRNDANSFSDPNTNPNHYAYSTVYGGDYCDRPHCNFENLTPILVRNNKTTQLRPQNTKPTGGRIIGRISDPLTPDGQPIKDAVSDAPYAPFYTANWLSIYNEDKELITTNYASGSFQFNLPAGHYYLKTGHGQFGFTNRYYASILYPNVDCAGLYCDFSQGTLVEVKDGEDTHLDDMLLKRGHGIKGQVTDKQTGQGLGGIRVQVLNSDQHLVSSVFTSEDGYYSHWGLLPGSYYLRTENGNKNLNERYKMNKPIIGGYINQLYPETVCPNNQCDFSQVTTINIGSDDIDNFNFALTTGELFTGTLTDKKSGNPLFKKRVKIFQTNGIQVGNHLTDEIGGFTTSALLPGNYKILVDGGYLYLDKAVGNDEKNCLFEACEWDDAETITLSPEPLNIQLTHKKDILPHYTGMWFNPEESGHGLQFEVLDQDNAAILYVTWFAHVDGEPMWLTGSGPLLGDRAFVNLMITDGKDFPGSMNPKMWGELRIKFDNLNQASLSWEPLLEGFESGELDVERLTIPTVPEEDAYLNADLNLDACITGSYYDPERNGEGLQITALGDPVDYLSFNWYTYHGDEQFWFTGQGDINQDQTISLAYYTQGTNFTPDFNPNDVQSTAWGEVRIQKRPGDKLEVEFTPNTDHSDFESRTAQLIRNSSPFTMQCGLH